MSPDWMTGLTLKSKIAFAAAKGASSCLKHERYGPATPNIHVDQGYVVVVESAPTIVSVSICG
jgi:hypothetical protein